MIEAGTWGAALAGDFVPQQAKEVTRRLMAGARRPTALVYDSEVMAIAGMATLAELDLSVPGDVSVVSWEDSTTCQVLHPTLTALNRDAVALGRQAATRMLHLLATDPTEPEGMTMQVLQRESTAAPTR